MVQPHGESWVDRLIREAQERGEFDNLPGAGKPLGDLGDPNDPDWWVKGLIRREGLDVSGALPTPLALRKEAAGFPQSLADVRSEAQVREILEDYNRRVRIDRLRPAVGSLPPLLARTVEVDALVAQWRALRSAAAPSSAAPTSADATAEAGPESAAPASTAPASTAARDPRRWARWWTRWWPRQRR